MRRVFPILAACAAAATAAFVAGTRVEGHLSGADLHGLLLSALGLGIVVCVLVSAPFTGWLLRRWPQAPVLLVALGNALVSGLLAYAALMGMHLHLHLFGHGEVGVFAIAAAAAGAMYSAVSMIHSRRHYGDATPR